MVREKRLQALFSGTVQGVGFRFTTRSIASRLPVKGYVKNLSNGKVEVVAEGEERDIKAFVEQIRRSDLASFIRDVDTQWHDATGEFTKFEIQY